jgi:hypothetical protein
MLADITTLDARQERHNAWIQMIYQEILTMQ